MPVSLIEEANKARSWLISIAFPLWFAKGVDWTQGGFFDSLDLNNAENCANRKRLRVATRQIYVFSEAARLGFTEGSVAVSHGIDFLFSYARHPDGAFASHFNLASKQTSGDRDSYDLAFVLFALAHAYKLLGEERLLIEAEQLAGFFDTVLRHPKGGFVEGLPAQLPRRQNPHMHLLEAAISWLPFDRSGAFRKLADGLVFLFETAFFDAEKGFVLEYFDDALTTKGEHFRDAVEPGHLFEWIWLMSCYDRATRRMAPSLQKMYDFAHRHGRNTNGLLYGELTSSGAVRDLSVRLWPHAEWVRAEVIQLKAHPNGDSAALELALSALWRFLDAPVAGLWFERFDHQGDGFLHEPAPASSLYHIVGAFSALIDTQWPGTENGKQFNQTYLETHPSSERRFKLLETDFP